MKIIIENNPLLFKDKSRKIRKYTKRFWGNIVVDSSIDDPDSIPPEFLPYVNTDANVFYFFKDGSGFKQIDEEIANELVGFLSKFKGNCVRIPINYGGTLKRKIWRFIINLWPFKKHLTKHEKANRIVELFHAAFCDETCGEPAEFREPLSEKHMEYLELAYHIIEFIEEN